MVLTKGRGAFFIVEESQKALPGGTMTITEVDEVVSTIESSVEEQSAATKEITENIVQVTQGMLEADVSVNQTTNVTAEIAKDIAEISQSANEMAASSSHVSMNAEGLTNLSDQLNRMIQDFRGQHPESDTLEPAAEAVSEDEFIDVDP